MKSLVFLGLALLVLPVFGEYCDITHEPDDCNVCDAGESDCNPVREEKECV